MSQASTDSSRKKGAEDWKGIVYHDEPQTGGRNSRSETGRTESYLECRPKNGNMVFGKGGLGGKRS